jgi:hypothetical protein
MINLIGIEIEGNYTRDNDRRLSAIHNRHNDGSILEECGYCASEYVSKPCTLSEAIEFINDCYPDNVNSSMGYHIHLSVNSIDEYSLLMTKEFFEYIKLAMFKFLETLKGTEDYQLLKKRLDGDNRYCYMVFNNPMQQIINIGYDGVRYSMLNFCFNKHKTFELRILPMFKNKNNCIKALEFYYKVVNIYLKKHHTIKFESVIDTNKKNTVKIKNNTKEKRIIICV